MNLAAYPPEVDELIDELVVGVRDALRDNLAAVFPRGSLALDDFDPEYSDVDVFVVTERRIQDAEFEALRLMHDRLRTLPNRYAAGLEVAYLDREAIRRFEPHERHPTITSHGEFRWERQDSNWVLERWMAREHATSRHGPEPRTLIDAIGEGDLRESARVRVREWGTWAECVSAEDRAWYNERAHQRYVIETICRGLYTVVNGTLPTKQQAVDWAATRLPEPWRKLLERSAVWRVQEDIDEATATETSGFVRWAAAKVGR